MKTVKLMCMIIFSAACLCFPSTGDAGKHALVIGNGNYKGNPLRTPVNDANVMTSVLKGLGFSVVRKTDLNHKQMEDAIRSFGTRLSGGDTGLFYFSGHGTQIKGVNFLIPTRTRIASADEVKYKAVPAGMVLDKMENSGSQLNIVILDACRNNPFKGFKSPNRGLAPMIASGGEETFIAYATAPGTVARTGLGSESIYTKYLAKAMKTPGMKIEDVFKRVRASVLKETSGEQKPWETTSLLKDHYLAGGSIIRDEPDRYSGPRTGSLLVETKPSGARVYVNGISKGKSPAELTGLKPGRMTVQSVLSGYRTEEEQVSVEKGRIQRVTLVMDRIQEEEDTKPRRSRTERKPAPEPAVTGDVIRLRGQPRTFSEQDVKKMLAKHNFFDIHKNESGDFENDFVESGDGKTVTDRRTGLMWQQSGSDKQMVAKDAQAYIRKLNSRQFAGYSDWRLPTVEELASLLEKRKMSDFYIDPVFDRKQQYCWSSDKRASGGAWYVYFFYGRVGWDDFYPDGYVRAVRPRQ
ncbi:caspase family protein [Desulfococcaceae bacterium HSG8]|nr:caspase family protein [Desulfococcaceae bacterium HSG8]